MVELYGERLGGRRFHIEVNGVNVTGTMTIPNTGSWQTWTTLTKTGVSLTAGQNMVRLVMEGIGTSGSVGNFNWLKISPAGSQR